MHFIRYDLGDLKEGHIVEVTLRGSAANVQLLDDEGFQSYKGRKPYRYVGGLATVSPIYLQVPHSSHWNLIIDMRGLIGTVDCSVKLMQTPPASMRTLMTQIMYNNGIESKVITKWPVPAKDDKYDVFITYVIEDWKKVVLPLSHSLAQTGLSVGVNEFEVKGGRPLLDSLNDGLASCRYGILVLSKSMLLKRWRNAVWESATERILSSKKPIFVIWHDVTESDVIYECGEELAKKPARWTGSSSIESIASEIAGFIKP